MQKKYKILIICGTRPEAIKLAPVYLKLKERKSVEVKILASGQHEKLLLDSLKSFNISHDFYLPFVRKKRTLSFLTSQLIKNLEKVILNYAPQVALVQGDTTTVFAAALTCFYNRIPLGHIEAGLRTFDIYNPFPEEINRICVGHIAKWHFAPTQTAKDNLLNNGINKKNIFITGNTGVDALYYFKKRFQNQLACTTKKVLITAHRRENIGRPLIDICRAIKTLAIKNPSTYFILSCHPNPSVKKIFIRFLKNIKNVKIIKPPSYMEFVSLMATSYVILTDSGGIQEEAPALGVPVLVLRTRTERPEAIKVGVAKLVGTKPNNIVRETQRLLTHKNAWKKMAKGISPFGDGEAATRIVSVLMASFKKN